MPASPTSLTIATAALVSLSLVLLPATRLPEPPSDQPPRVVRSRRQKYLFFPKLSQVQVGSLPLDRLKLVVLEQAANMGFRIAMAIILFLSRIAAGHRSMPALRSKQILPLNWASQDFRSAVAGGLAGGFTNGLLYPIDCAKTLRQSRPGQFKGTLDAMVSIAR